jgi:L-2,4-diaminobutyric acid acetyltransferase
MPADTDFIATHIIGETTLILRTPGLADAAGIRRIVRDSGVLDPNSAYCYLLLCRDFRDTCLVAVHDNEVVGFVTAYQPPQRPNVLFVWQIGVHPSQRQSGLARAMLRSLLSLPACRQISTLEATVTPSNHASRRLFQSLASALNVPFREENGFPATLFDAADHEAESHEAENLVRVGPWSSASLEHF